jgi:hypothetical protein
MFDESYDTAMERGPLGYLYLAVTLTCLIAVPSAAIVPPLRAAIVPPLAWVAASVAMLLFLQMLFDRTVRRSIDAISIEMREKRLASGKMMTPLDPEWGVFGRRVGDRFLLAVRAVALVELMLVEILSGRSDRAIQLLAFAGFFIAMELSILHTTLSTASNDPS